MSEPAILMLSADLTHPIKEAREATPGLNLAKSLGRRGNRVIFFSVFGEQERGLGDITHNLRPRIRRAGNLTYLFPPVLRARVFGTVLSLFTSSVFLIAFVVLTRLKLRFVYAGAVLTGTVGLVLRQLLGCRLIVNYGDPKIPRVKGLYWRVNRVLERVVYASGRAEAAVYFDPIIGEYLRSSFRNLRCVFLPPGGYSSAYGGTTSEQLETVREKYNLSSSKVIVYIGHLSRPPYRVDLLIRAVGRVIKKRSGVKFLVVGEGKDRLELMRLAESLGIAREVVFLKPIPFGEVPAFLGASDIALQATEDICLGTKVIAYMACAKAVVSAGALWNQYAEFLLSGHNCILTPLNAAEISDAIAKLLDDDSLRESLGRNALRTIEPYEWGRQAETIMSLVSNSD